MTQCANKRCTCLALLGDASARASIAKYLNHFKQRNKDKKDSIVFELFRYSSFLKPSTQQKRTKKRILLCLPYIDNGTAIDDEMVRIHLICMLGLQRLWHPNIRGVINPECFEVHICDAGPQEHWEEEFAKQ